MAKSTTPPPADRPPPPAGDDTAALTARIAELERQQREQTERYRAELERSQQVAAAAEARSRELAAREARVREEAAEQVRRETAAAAGAAELARWKVSCPWDPLNPVMVLAAYTAGDAVEKYKERLGIVAFHGAQPTVKPSDEPLTPADGSVRWVAVKQAWVPAEPSPSALARRPTAPAAEPAAA